MLILILLLMITVAGCAKKIPPFDENAWKQQVEATDSGMLYAEHIDADGKFYNPWLVRDHTNGGIFTYLTSEKIKVPDYPKEKYLPVENSYNYLKDQQNSSISFVGHASFIIKMDRETILTDPFFSGKALVKRVETNIKFDFEKLPGRPVVLISHNHYDHLDKYSVKKLIRKDAVFVVPLNLTKFFTSLGAKEVHELDWWQSITIDGITYTFLPAQHWSRRMGQSANTTLWGGFLIEGSKKIYFSGDTGYFKGFAEFGKKFPDIDYAVIASGAYLPRWFMHYAHQDINEFFMAADDLNAKVTIPMHFGVIQLGQEPITYPPYEIEKYMEEHPEYEGKINTLMVGEYMMTEEGDNE